MSGAGDTITPMIISLVTTVAIRVPLAYTIAHFTKSETLPAGSPDSLFISLYEVISNLRLSHIEYFVGLRMDHERILEEHHEIYRALICRDAQLAEKLMYDHLTRVSNFM